MTSRVNDGGSAQAPENLRLRLMIAAPDEATLALLISSIEAHLCDFAKIFGWSAERYWKFPELFDCDLVLVPLVSSSLAFDGIVGLATHWWSYGDDEEIADREAIWSRNVSPDGIFIQPQIEWAQLSLNYPPASPEATT